MRILVVTYSFPPDENPRAFRWGGITDQLAAGGHKIDVVTRTTGNEPQVSHRRNGVHVYRASEILTGTLRDWSTSRENSSSERPAVDAGRTRWGLPVRLAKSVHRLTWKQILWPDFACLWIGGAVRLTRQLLQQYRYDALITVSSPFSSHLIGRQVQPWNDSLPWLVDLGDPFSPVQDVVPNNSRLYARANYRAEKDVLDRCDRVTVTTERTREVYSETFVGAEEKLTVIPPMLTQPATSPTPPRGRRSDRIRLIYTGTLYRSIRSPAPLLELVRQLRARGHDIVVDIYGQSRDCGDLLPRTPGPEGVCLHGPVSRGDVWQQLQQSDVLVNIGNATPCQLPSKVVEYLATGRSILNLVEHPQDSSAEFFAGHSHVLTLQSSAGRFTTADMDQAEQFLLNPPAASPGLIQQVLQQHSPAAVTQQYEQLILDCAADRSRV